MNLRWWWMLHHIMHPEKLFGFNLPTEISTQHPQSTHRSESHRMTTCIIISHIIGEDAHGWFNVWKVISLCKNENFKSSQVYSLSIKVPLKTAGYHFVLPSINKKLTERRMHPSDAFTPAVTIQPETISPCEWVLLESTGCFKKNTKSKTHICALLFQLEPIRL